MALLSAASRRRDVPLLVVLALGAAVLGWVAGGHPSVALLAALGGALVATVLANLSLGLCLFALLGVMDVLSKNGAVSGTKVLGAVLIVSWLGGNATRARRRQTLSSAHPALVACLVALLAWTAVSVLWAPSAANGVTMVERLGLNLALFPIVFSAIGTRRHAMWLFGAIVFAGAATVAYALASGGATLPAETFRGTARLSLKGGLGDPNVLAAVLVVSVALAGALFACLKGHPVLRFACMGAAAVSLAGIALTVSRGGIIALIAMTAAAIAFGGRWRARIVVGALVVGAALTVYFAAFAPAATVDRLTHAAGGSGRNEAWSLAWRMTLDHPLGGVGAGGFPALTSHYLLAPGTSTSGTYLQIVQQAVVAHNTYLQILAELGIVGLLALLGVAAASLRSLVNAVRAAARSGDVRLELLARGTLVALIGLLVADFFLSAQYSKPLWLMLAIGPALLAAANRRPPPRRAMARRSECAAWVLPRPTAAGAMIIPPIVSPVTAPPVVERV